MTTITRTTACCGLVSGLTPEQRALAIAYDGEEVAGVPNDEFELAIIEREADEFDGIWRDHCRLARTAREDARKWRAKERAASLAPLSAKVVYPRRLVDVAAAPKKRGTGK